MEIDFWTVDLAPIGSYGQFELHRRAPYGKLRFSARPADQAFRILGIAPSTRGILELGSCQQAVHKAAAAAPQSIEDQELSHVRELLSRELEHGVAYGSTHLVWGIAAHPPLVSPIKLRIVAWGVGLALLLHFAIPASAVNVVTGVLAGALAIAAFIAADRQERQMLLAQLRSTTSGCRALQELPRPHPTRVRQA